MPGGTFHFYETSLVIIMVDGSGYWQMVFVAAPVLRMNSLNRLKNEINS
jgi:hypothetical protein